MNAKERKASNIHLNSTLVMSHHHQQEVVRIYGLLCSTSTIVRAALLCIRWPLK